MDRREWLESIDKNVDLGRIKNLALSEKFKLVHFVNLIYREAQFAASEGKLQLGNSVNYTKNKTYNLFAMLHVNGTKPEVIEEIMVNYARNFDKSDIYYSKIIIIGLGLLMIEKEFAPNAIYNYLMSLMGVEFLTENLNYNGYPPKIKDEDLNLESEIIYKPFEGNRRKIKYNLLGLLKLSHENGIPYVADLINTKYDDKRFRFFFNMLNVTSPDMVDFIYHSMKDQPIKLDRLLIRGAYCIMKGSDIYTSHYVFNSILGKYSRYDKNSREIEDEVNSSIKGILDL